MSCVSLLIPAKVVNSELIMIIGLTISVSSDWRSDQHKNKFQFVNDDQCTSSVQVPFMPTMLQS